MIRALHVHDHFFITPPSGQPHAIFRGFIFIPGRWIIIIIIIMYIYHALINALSAHMIHINLNTIFCAHVEHLPNQFTYIRYYMETNMHAHTHTHIHTHTHTHTHTHIHTHTHTHTHTYSHTCTQCCRNWVLILVRVEILWEEEGFQFGFKRWQGWAVVMHNNIFIHVTMGFLLPLTSLDVL